MRLSRSPSSVLKSAIRGIAPTRAAAVVVAGKAAARAKNRVTVAAIDRIAVVTEVVTGAVTVPRAPPRGPASRGSTRR